MKKPIVLFALLVLTSTAALAQSSDADPNMGGINLRDRSSAGVADTRNGRQIGDENCDELCGTEQMASTVARDADTAVDAAGTRVGSSRPASN